MSTRDQAEGGRLRSATATAPPNSAPQTARRALTATPMKRADELLRQMTVEEKAMQLSAL